MTTEKLNLNIETRSKGEEAFRKLEKNFNSLSKKHEKMTNQTKRGARDFQGGMQKSSEATGRFAGVLSNLGGVLAGVFSTATITRFFRMYNEEMDKAAAREQLRQMNLAQSLTSSGDLTVPGRPAEIQKFLTGVDKSSRLDYEQIRGSFDNVRGILRGGGPDYQNTLGIVKTVSTQGQDVLGEDQRNAVLQYMAVALQGDPNRDKQGLFNAAVKATAGLGSDVGGFASMTRALQRSGALRGAVDKSEAFDVAAATVLAVARGGERATSAATLLDTIERGYDPTYQVQMPKFSALIQRDPVAALDAMMRGDKQYEGELIEVMEASQRNVLNNARRFYPESYKTVTDFSPVDLKGGFRATVGDVGVRLAEATAKKKDLQTMDATAARERSAEYQENINRMREPLPYGFRWMGSALGYTQTMLGDTPEAIDTVGSKVNPLRAAEGYNVSASIWDELDRQTAGNGGKELQSAASDLKDAAQALRNQGGTNVYVSPDTQVDDREGVN